MQVRRTQGYNMQFGMNHAEALKKANITTSVNQGRILIYGAVSRLTGKPMGAITMFGANTPERVFGFLKTQHAKLPNVTTHG